MKNKTLFAIFFTFVFILIGGFSYMFTGRTSTNQKFVILDFDGVIADSWQIAFETMNSYSEEFGFLPMSFDAASDLTTKEIFKAYNLGFFAQFRLASKVKSALHENMNKIDVFPEFLAICKRLSEQGIEVAIITSNSKENVDKFFSHNKIDFIKIVHSTTSIFGKDSAIKSFLKEYGVKKETAIYVGDEVRDVTGAKKAGIPVMAVTWGFDPRAKLLQEGPDYLVHDSKHAQMILEKYFQLN